MCGAGGIPFLNSSHYFLFKYVVGHGTNNRVEFYGL
jgi:hypothetical protein